jgi:hypothetical protein
MTLGNIAGDIAGDGDQPASKDAQIGLFGDSSAAGKTTRYRCGRYNRAPVFFLLLTGDRPDVGLSSPRLREPIAPIRHGRRPPSMSRRRGDGRRFVQ